MSPRPVIVAAYVVSVAVFVVAAGAWFLEAHAELRQLRQSEAATQQLVADAKKRLAEQQRTIERLKNDPAFVEKVVRQNLFYVRPDEIIIRYQD